MTHIDSDQLALIALGEVAPSAGEAEHLASCAACAAELRELTTVVHRGRSAQGESLAEPSPAVWERIRSQIDADEAVRPVSGAEMSHMAAQPAEKSPSATSRPASDRARRRWRTRFVAPVAVAALVVGLVAGTGVGHLVAVGSEREHRSRDRRCRARSVPRLG